MSTTTSDAKYLEKLDHIVKLSERKIASLSNLKAKIINMRSLESHFNDKTFILKNCYDLEEGLKQEIHSASILYDEVKEAALNSISLDTNFKNLQKEYNTLLADRKVVKEKLTDYDKEIIALNEQIKIYETELRMHDNIGGKLDTNVKNLAISQQQIKTENTNLKIRLHDTLADYKKTKSMLTEMINLYRNFGNENRNNDTLQSVRERQNRIRRVTDIIHKLNVSRDLFDYISSKVSVDFLSNITLMRCEETFIDKIEKMIRAYEVNESKEVLELIEYEKEKKIKMNEINLFDKEGKENNILTNKSSKVNLTKNLDFSSSMTPKRGFQSKLSLDSPAKKSSMENYFEYNNKPIDISELQLVPEIESSRCGTEVNLSNNPGIKKMSTLSSKKNSNTIATGDPNSPSKKFKSLYPDQIEKSPKKIIAIPSPSKVFIKKKSMLETKLDKEEQFESLKEDYLSTKEAIKKQSTLK